MPPPDKDLIIVLFFSELQSSSTQGGAQRILLVLFVLQFFSHVFSQRPAELCEEPIEVFPVLSVQGEFAVFSADDVL